MIGCLFGFGLKMGSSLVRLGAFVWELLKGDRLVGLLEGS